MLFHINFRLEPQSLISHSIRDRGIRISNEYISLTGDTSVVAWVYERMVCRRRLLD